MIVHPSKEKERAAIPSANKAKFFFRDRAWARFSLRGRKKVATKGTGHSWYRP